MPRRDLLVMIIAGISGVVVFIIMLSYIKTSKQPPPVVVPLVRCVTASNTILKDQEIKETSVVLGEPTENPNVSNYFVNVSDIIGYTAKQDIPKDSMIKRDWIEKRAPAPVPVEPPKPTSLPVPLGMRSISIETTIIESPIEEIALGNYYDIMTVLPNDRSGIASASAPTDGIEAKTIASSVQVLQIADSASGKSKIVTLALRPRNFSELIKTINKGRTRVRLIKRADNGANMGNLGYIEIIRGITKEKSFQGQEFALKRD